MRSLICSPSAAPKARLLPCSATSHPQQHRCAGNASPQLGQIGSSPVPLRSGLRAGPRAPGPPRHNRPGGVPPLGLEVERLRPSGPSAGERGGKRGGGRRGGGHTRGWTKRGGQQERRQRQQGRPCRRQQKHAYYGRRQHRQLRRSNARAEGLKKKQRALVLLFKPPLRAAFLEDQGSELRHTQPSSVPTHLLHTRSLPRAEALGRQKAFVSISIEEHSRDAGAKFFNVDGVKVVFLPH